MQPLTPFSIEQQSWVELGLCLMLKCLHLTTEGSQHRQHFVQDLVVRADQLQHCCLLIGQHLSHAQIAILLRITCEVL